MSWIHLSQNMDEWDDFVKTVRNLTISEATTSFLTGQNILAFQENLCSMMSVPT